MRQLKIGTSGVRGVVGDAMTPELVVDFAAAFGTYCGGETVVIGRDTRPSSTLFHSAVLAALISTGADTIDLGICTTPMVSHAVRRLGAAGGISITGSHNDGRWNALKFLGPDGGLLNSANTEELLDIYHASAFLLAPWHGLRGVRSAPTMIDDYVDTLCDALDIGAIRGRKFRVALDFCNGAATDAGRAFLERAGCTLIGLNDDASGQFAHPPAPSPANMRQLAALMRSVDADLGAALNIDGDRLGLVLGSGQALSEEATLPLAVRAALIRKVGSVVINQSTSRMTEALAAECGCPCYRTSVGEGHVMERALNEAAVIAGEGNGGVALLPTAHTFDALLTLGLLLEHSALHDVPLEISASSLPEYHMRKGELRCPPEQVYRLLEGIRERFADTRPDLSDGIRFDWPDAWLHIRASNTEPLLRVIVEAETEGRAEELFSSTMALTRRAAWAYGGR
ncbi:MAG: phosphoglucosamine mutase [Chthonomonadales bacterium]|nr:phosphoglucosamine mutase [Chthonomonadales bacterium]